MAPVPIFTGRVTDDVRLELTEHERTQRRLYLQSLAGCEVEIVIRKKREQRSLDQNKYLHAVPFTLLAEYWGEDIETTKLLVLGEWAGWRETKDGHRVPMKPSTSALTIDEGTNLIEWIPPWAQIHFGVIVPLPNEATA